MDKHYREQLRENVEEDGVVVYCLDVSEDDKGRRSTGITGFIHSIGLAKDGGKDLLFIFPDPVKMGKVKNSKYRNAVIKFLRRLGRGRVEDFEFVEKKVNLIDGFRFSVGKEALSNEDNLKKLCPLLLEFYKRPTPVLRIFAVPDHRIACPLSGGNELAVNDWDQIE